MNKAQPTSKVYFTKVISQEKLCEIYDKLEIKLDGKVAVKIHSGEHDKTHTIQPTFMKPLVDKVKGTLVECNTGIGGDGWRRFHSEDHWKLIKQHGFTDIAPFDIMDEEGIIELPVTGGKHLKVNYVGSHLKNYDSILVLSHFKGHALAGFGGAMKNVAIGIASSKGKCQIHGGYTVEDIMASDINRFIEAMADAVKSVIDYKKGKMVYISVMKDISIDCDCDPNPHAPEMKDIGILASIDPVALDQACVDLIYKSNDKGKENLIKRIEEKNGLHLLECGEQLGIGSIKYEIISID